MASPQPTPRKPRARTQRTTTMRLPPAETLDVEITLAPPPGEMSITSLVERPLTGSVERFRADPLQVARAVQVLERLGFSITIVGDLTISAKISRPRYEETFSTSLDRFSQPIFAMAQSTPLQEFFFPPTGASWAYPAELAGLVDDAYIQWPPIYFGNAFPPRVGYHHLRVPGDVAAAVNACRVHREGTTGKGVKVAMVDSGFFTGHPYFARRGYNMSVVLAPGATDATRDGNGHGTAECANLLAIAPDVTFIGVKVGNEESPALGASLAEGFKTAVKQNPDIITVSLGFDLVTQGTRTHLGALPNSLKPLEAEVRAAVQAGIVVVFSAGNGHVAFPGMMPEVISAGGAFVGEDFSTSASDYASAFASRIYPGRHVPDLAGLVGLVNTAGAYIMLPVQDGCSIDRSTAANTSFRDGTRANDGWACISGTSAAAPQIAGVCALLKQKNRGLTPADIKNALRRTARDVTVGSASAASNQGAALRAGAGADGATGDGLVDAFAAWRQV